MTIIIYGKLIPLLTVAAERIIAKNIFNAIKMHGIETTVITN